MMAARGRGVGRGYPATNDVNWQTPRNSNWPRPSGVWLQAGQMVERPRPGVHTSNWPRPGGVWLQAGQMVERPRPGVHTSNGASARGRIWSNSINSAITHNPSTVAQPNPQFRFTRPDPFPIANVRTTNPHSQFVDAFHLEPVEEQLQASSSVNEISDGVPTLLNEPESPEPAMTAERKHKLELRKEIASSRRIRRGRQAEKKKQRRFDGTNEKLAESREEMMPLRDRPWNRLVHRPYYTRLQRATNEFDSLNLQSSSRHVPDFLAVADNANFATAYQVDPTEVGKYRSLHKVTLTGEGTSCTLCLESIVEATLDLLRCERCQKLFHEDCVVLWLAEHKKCPNCRHIWPRND